MALSPAEMDAAVLANLAGKTGRTPDDWIGLLDGAGPFEKPAAAVTWLKTTHGLGHVTAQIIVRKWRERDTDASEGDPVAAVLGTRGAALLRDLHAVLAADRPEVRLMPRKAYVGLGAPVQFAVAARPRHSGAVLVLALVGQDTSRHPLPPAPRLGGSDRFRLLLEVGQDDDMGGVLAHLRAAAGL
ncbi:DUF4287 domain-containing protein [Roseicyclus sp.]|uniref:DUF4287 domain-containing protein n=1 Tax=Roseicyclus sp. TaxID=1914329 RepID=UPI003FA0308F